MSPVIISFKILLQQLWQQNLQWDEPLPQKLLEVWNHLISDIDSINSIQVSRHILVNHPVHVELHCFSDASQSAYGCCIYIKSIDATGQAVISLACSKSRVAPLKTLSIPRLELCGAVLTTRLSKKVSQALKININACYYWVDSTIVLSWISTCPSKLKVFVSNRIAEIQRCTNVQQWAQVSSSDNPADLVSRGINATELKQCTLWWNGPSWLVHKQADWPKISEVEVKIPELKPKKLTLLAREQSEFKLIERFSSLHRARRVTAWCFRFYHNLKLPAAKRNLESLSVSELNNSTIALLKLAQRTMFPDEISCIVNNKPISKKSKLVPFDPIVDKQGLLRIGGRLNKSSLPYDSKHQILLQPKHHLTRLIVLNEHYRQMHAGVYQLLCAIRQNYWILHGRRVIKTILSKCIVCFRCRPKNIIQKMADLPSDRVTPLRPFYVSGVDFCGPFLIKDGKFRNRAIIKAYLCIFICFTTKAVHLEAVSDLSSQAFLNALHRFVSRRGICHKLYSDNATNFVGSNNELTKISQEILNFTTDPEVANFMLNNSISWKFIPPRSPHHGGLWESAVKRAKFHITRILGKQVLTFEGLSTLFTQVEAVMNSRPITPTSDDPSDLSVLTPGHFLVGEPLVTFPQHDLTELPSNRLDQFQTLQQRYQLFWKRWTKDYLLELQRRSKWHSDPNPDNNTIRSGSMVLIIDDNSPPLLWRLGRVIDLHPGTDSKTRVVTVRTANGDIVRAVQKLCLLPLEVQSSC
nr:unnamed protein product [Callosobruchus chinensis]